MYAGSLDLIGSVSQDVRIDTGVDTKNIILKNAGNDILTIIKDRIRVDKPLFMNYNMIFLNIIWNFAHC